MVEPEVDRWAWVEGPDKTVSVSGEIYRRDIPGGRDNGVLCASTGNTCNIYAVAEINGYLYLAKGAVFDYREFILPEKE
jgi:hypothetical protein